MDIYIGEIRAFSFSFVPEDWLACNGQIVLIRDYQALYTLLGKRYGGDGQTTFGLPNLNGRTVIGTGTSPVSGHTYNAGDTGGTEYETITSTQLALHNHPVITHSVYDIGGANTNFLGNPNIKGSTTANNTANANFYSTAGTVNTTLGPALNAVGNGKEHDNRQPFLVTNFCIAATNFLYPVKP